MAERRRRKVRTGVVVSDQRDRTITVEVTDTVLHPEYGKTVQRRKRLHVYDEHNDAHLGDSVKVMETRPLSKTKRWRMVEIVERAK
ncbi:MAG: 30S ribosomal protein S17 [Acidimicrobiia bacterium]